MSTQSNEHPIKDLLAEFAMGEKNSDIEEHISSCVECQEYINEVKSVTSVLEKFPEDDVPFNLQDKILKSVNKKGPAWFEFNSTKRILNPFIISLGLIGLTILLYIFMVFVL